jgi:hypothetical protein
LSNECVFYVVLGTRSHCLAAGGGIHIQEHKESRLVTYRSLATIAGGRVHSDSKVISQASYLHMQTHRQRGDLISLQTKIRGGYTGGQTRTNT